MKTGPPLIAVVQYLEGKVPGQLQENALSKLDPREREQGGKEENRCKGDVDG